MARPTTSLRARRDPGGRDSPSRVQALHHAAPTRRPQRSGQTAEGEHLPTPYRYEKRSIHPDSMLLHATAPQRLVVSGLHDGANANADLVGDLSAARNGEPVDLDVAHDIAALLGHRETSPDRVVGRAAFDSPELGRGRVVARLHSR